MELASDVAPLRESVPVLAEVVDGDGRPVAGVAVHWTTAILLPYGGQCPGCEDVPPVPSWVRREGRGVTDSSGIARNRVRPVTLQTLAVTATVGPRSYTIEIDPVMPEEFDGDLVWDPVGYMERPRDRVSPVVFGNRIYVVGGECHVPPTACPWTWSLDPSSGSWEEHAQAPRQSGDAGVAAATSHGIHLMRRTDHHVYDPAVDAWAERAAPPVDPEGGVLETIADTMYLIAATGDVYAYDPDADRWSERARKPWASRWAASAVVDGLIYVAGGGDDRLEEWVEEARVYHYDPVDDFWQRELDMPFGRRFLTGGTIDGRFCFFGGGVTQRGTSIDFPEMYCYDPEEHQWALGPPVPHPSVIGVAAVEFEGDIYAFGGARWDYRTGLVPNMNVSRLSAPK